MTAPARDVQGSMFPDLAPERPQGWIMPSVFRGTNAELIAAVAPMYLDGSVLDVTYGDGAWWTKATPNPFTAHDLYKLDGVDFRQLPEDDNSIDTVCFDPPYAPSGTLGLNPGPRTFRERYGIDRETGYRCEDDLRDLISDGLSETCRVARGFVLVKCMEFTSSREFHDMPEFIIARAVKHGAGAHGWQLHDQIVHHTGSGPGGHNIYTPVRARRHHSYLLVFTKAAR